VLVALGLALSSCASSSSSIEPASSSQDPLSGGVSQSGAAMAVVPMGHLDDPANTFYETFSQASTGSWSLSTPVGTATNGGIVLSQPVTGMGAVLGWSNLRNAAGFGLASGRQSGTTGVLPDLAREPSAVAFDPLTGEVAVLRANASVSVGPSLGGPFHVATTTADLERTPGLSCSLSRLTAIAFTTQGQLAVGGACASGSSLGVFIQTTTSASGAPMGFSPAASWGDAGGESVVRLDPGGHGVVALVRFGGASPKLIALSLGTGASSPGRSEGVSLSTAVPIAGALVSTAATGVGTSGTEELVAVRRPRGVAVLELPSASLGVPRTVAGLGSSTSAVTSDGAGRIVAFEVTDGGTLTIRRWTGASWAVTQLIKVQVPYGSSS
jgi:hypothetical protein